MKKYYVSKHLRLFLYGILIIISGCVPYSKLSYINDIDELKEPAMNPMQPRIINTSDKLHITVLSTDDQTKELLNSYNQLSTDNTRGHLVDETGYIDYPFIGKIHVAGLTSMKAADTISLKMAKSGIIKDPQVVVNLIDNMVTIIGEVNNPGRYLMAGDFINIYQAIALGNGMSQYADRKKVILIRNENNKLVHYKLNLSNSSIASSPLFYVLPNDIIIVEPLRKKSFSYQNATLSTFLTSLTAVLSLISIITLRQVIN
jgi:polysaccharide export outer membrane protein